MHSASGVTRLLGWVSRPGFPGSSTDLSARADSNHPGEPGGCVPVASPPVTGFTISGRLATLKCVTRPNRVRGTSARAFALRGFAPAGLLPPALAWLHVERAIHMMTTFQVTRSARLILAHQRTRRGSGRG